MSKKALFDLADAMLAWTGWQTEVTPCRDDIVFTSRYGVEQAEKWLPVLHSLEDDYYASDARYTASDLQEMSALSSEQFRKKHPEVEEPVIQALTWCYTFDYK